MVSLINASIVNSQSNLLNITNLSANNASFSITNISTLTCYNKLIFSNSVLGTNYTGSRIILWPGSGTPTSTDWYGLGMNSYTMLYNGPTSAKHSFQINGTEYAYINSTGITTTNSNITTMNCSTLVINDSTGNAFQIGTGPNAWLFNTYPYASLNGCFLGIRSNAIGGSWSSTLFNLDCTGNLTLIGNLTCNNTITNNVYLNDVLTPSKKTNAIIRIW